MLKNAQCIHAILLLLLLLLLLLPPPPPPPPTTHRRCRFYFFDGCLRDVIRVRFENDNPFE
jgi:hypothetical protein